MARCIGWSWASRSRRHSFGCGRRLLDRHGMDKPSRAASMLRALRRSSWSSGAWSPYSSGRIGVEWRLLALLFHEDRGLSTHDTAAWGVIDESSPSCGRAAIVWWLWLPQAVSGSFATSRLTALIIVVRRLVALFFLMVGVLRPPTPLLRQWLLIHFRHLAGL